MLHTLQHHCALPPSPALLQDGILSLSPVDIIAPVPLEHWDVELLTKASRCPPFCTLRLLSFSLRLPCGSSWQLMPCRRCADPASEFVSCALHPCRPACPLALAASCPRLSLKASTLLSSA